MQLGIDLRTLEKETETLCISTCSSLQRLEFPAKQVENYLMEHKSTYSCLVSLEPRCKMACQNNVELSYFMHTMMFRVLKY